MTTLPPSRRDADPEPPARSNTQPARPTPDAALVARLGDIFGTDHAQRPTPDGTDPASDPTYGQAALLLDRGWPDHRLEAIARDLCARSQPLQALMTSLDPMDAVRRDTALLGFLNVGVAVQRRLDHQAMSVCGESEDEANAARRDPDVLIAWLAALAAADDTPVIRVRSTVLRVVGVPASTADSDHGLSSWLAVPLVMDAYLDAYLDAGLPFDGYMATAPLAAAAAVAPGEAAAKVAEGRFDPAVVASLAALWR